jgi:DNA adenine methylase
MLQPVIKWSGSKRKSAEFITSFIPKTGTYFEPFLGGGSILGALGNRPGYAGDQIPELIGIWDLVKSDPSFLANSYEKSWNGLQREGHTYYYKVRDRFNKKRNPEDLLFLSRTCVNGLIRFNTYGDFNNSLHHTRPGIHPETLRSILLEWSKIVSKTKFAATDYENLLKKAKLGDIVYMDPPYMGNKGRYKNEQFDFERLWHILDDLNKRKVKWILSLDGKSGDRDYSKALSAPKELSKDAYLLDGESSAFPRLLNSRLDNVTESLFLNFKIK